MSVGYQSFYQAQLTAGISDTDTDIPLDVVPTVDEGFLVIESTVPSKREIIYFTSKTSNSVVCPSGAGNGRGYDGTTAVSHLQGAAVIMAPVGAMFSELRQQFTTTPQGWTSIVPAVNSVTDNGNNSYTLNFASAVDSILSEGMRVRTTRNSAAGVTCFSLDGSNDYLNKTSPAGMTFTDDFTVSAWVYLTSYPVASIIASRCNGTSGWQFFIGASGQIQLSAFNAGSGNYSYVSSYQSVPLNKWVHVAAQLDMSTFTATTTTSYTMINGKDVPASVGRAGTNPTALIQAGNLEIGGTNGGTLPFPGYIKDVAIYNSKITQATIAERRNQPLTGSEANLISAYSGANTTDLNTTNANNLTAQNGAVTGFASAPWGNRGLSTTLDYGLVMAVSGSTATVQAPEGCTIPTTGGVSAVAYSVMASPFGFVSDKGRWEIGSFYRAAVNNTVAALNYENIASARVYKPTGNFFLTANGGFYGSTGATHIYNIHTSAAAAADASMTQRASSGGAFHGKLDLANIPLASTANTYYLNVYTTTAAGTLTLTGQETRTALTLLPAGL